MRAGAREHSDDIACPSSICFLMIHVGCLVATWTGVAWRAVALAMMLYVLRVFATGPGHCRYFAHRAFGTSRICQFASAFCQPRHVPRNFASEPTPPAIRRRSERVGGLPEALILRDPGICFGFGGKAGGRLRQSTGPGHLHGEAVIGSLDYATIRIGHGCP